MERITRLEQASTHSLVRVTVHTTKGRAFALLLLALESVPVPVAAKNFNYGPRHFRLSLCIVSNLRSVLRELLREPGYVVHMQDMIRYTAQETCCQPQTLHLGESLRNFRLGGAYLVRQYHTCRYGVP